MLTRWLTFMAFLAGSANPRTADSGRRAVTVAPTCRVKGQPEVELILNCGDGKHGGGVQFWHTPFGDLQPSTQRTDLDSVFVHHNGSLVIPNCSLLHSGLYYCVLQHSEGSTLWPYELHVGHNRNTDDKHEQDNSRAAHRTRRTVSPREEGVPPDGLFAGAVVASVLVTFVVGFSAGALTRTYVLRCWHAVTARLRSPKQRRRQADVPDHGSQVVITTLPPMHENRVLAKETTRDESPTCGNVEGRASVTTPSPPAKPKRSFRNKEEEDTAYLEGCDYTEERTEEAGGGVGAITEGSDEDETTQSSFYLEDEELQSETDEDKSIDGREEKEAAGEQEESKEEVMGENEGEQKTEEVKETECYEELDQSSAAAERGENKEEASSSAPRRRSRIIRLYQYDEDGQRYCHLPDPGPQGPEPAPRLKQRSLSLTRLNAIMAAAAAGPMEPREGEEAPHFHMEI